MRGAVDRLTVRWRSDGRQKGSEEQDLTLEGLIKARADDGHEGEEN